MYKTQSIDIVATLSLFFSLSILFPSHSLFLFPPSPPPHLSVAFRRILAIWSVSRSLLSFAHSSSLHRLPCISRVALFAASYSRNIQFEIWCLCIQTKTYTQKPSKDSTTILFSFIWMQWNKLKSTLIPKMVVFSQHVRHNISLSLFAVRVLHWTTCNFNGKIYDK